MTAFLTHPLGDGAALILRTPDIVEEYHAMLVANHERLTRWFPGLPEPTRDETLAALEESGSAWLAGDRLPLAITVNADGGVRLAGWVNLLIDSSARSAEVGYWLDVDFEGRGLVTRAVTAVLDHAFGTLGLQRIALHATADNERSLRVAERLGFTREGVLRAAADFADGRRDVVILSLLAGEWPQPA